MNRAPHVRNVSLTSCISKMILNVISQTLFPISFILIIAPAPPSRDYPLLLSCNIIYIYISLSSNFFCIDQRPPIYIRLVRIVPSNPLGLSWRLTMRKKKRMKKSEKKRRRRKIWDDFDCRTRPVSGRGTARRVCATRKPARKPRSGWWRS